MFISMELNRRNINRAISDNLLKDLGAYYLDERQNMVITDLGQA